MQPRKPQLHLECISCSCTCPWIHASEDHVARRALEVHGLALGVQCTSCTVHHEASPVGPPAAARLPVGVTSLSAPLPPSTRWGQAAAARRPPASRRLPRRCDSCGARRSPRARAQAARSTCHHRRPSSLSRSAPSSRPSSRPAAGKLAAPRPARSAAARRWAPCARATPSRRSPE